MVASKVVHSMRKKTGKGCKTLKLNMSKVHDRVEWIFFLGGCDEENGVCKYA